MLRTRKIGINIDLHTINAAAWSNGRQTDVYVDMQDQCHAVYRNLGYLVDKKRVSSYLGSMVSLQEPVQHQNLVSTI